MGKFDRLYIFWGLRDGYSIRKIAGILNRSPSTVSREIKRYSIGKRNPEYIWNKAQSEYKRNLSNSRKVYRLRNKKIRDFVIRKLKIGWSPEIIAGRITNHFNWGKISHEAIYQFIYFERPDLIHFLARGHRKRQKRKSVSHHKKSRIIGRISINNRRKSIINRKTAGHWEGDTIISRLSKSAIQITAERKTRYVKINKIKQKTSQCVSGAIIKQLKRMPSRLRKTITYDNGLENVLHLQVNKVLNTKSYFCNPYHSWEKGTVEQTAGLFRRFYPKKTNFNKVTSKDIYIIQNLLNNRPRKCLQYRTPIEAMRKEGVALTP